MVRSLWWVRSFFGELVFFLTDRLGHFLRV